MSATHVDIWLEQVEGDGGPFMCPWPGHDRSFTSKDALAAHLHFHHDDQLPDRYDCPRDECDATFPTREALELHLSVGHVPTIGGQPVKPEHNGSGEGGEAEMPRQKAFPCTKGCDKSFDTQQGRALHETRIHKGKPGSSGSTRRKPTGGRRPRQPAAVATRAPDPELQHLDQLLEAIEQLSPPSRAWLVDRLSREEAS